MKRDGSFRDRLKKSGKVFIVGVGGDSGSGKTTFVRGIRDILGDDVVSSFSLDDYHIYDREERKKRKVTPLNPKANNLDGLARDLRRLKEGKDINKPVYDHSNGKFKKPVRFRPTPVVVIEGLHPFYTKALREVSDFKVFVEPDKKIKKKWKLKRDVQDRGHKKEDVIAEMMAREPDYEKYIDEQKIYAEVIIEVHPTEVTEADDIYQIRLVQRSVDIPLEELDLSLDLSTMLRLSEKSFAFEYRRDECYGHFVGALTMDGEIHRDVVRNLEDKISKYTGRRRTFFGGKEYISTTNLAQLIICWRFIEKANSILSKRK